MIVMVVSAIADTEATQRPPKNENDDGKIAIEDAMFLYDNDGNHDGLILTLDKGAAIDSKNEYGNTALILASHQGNLECIRLLLNKNANIYYSNSEGVTALHAATAKGHLDCVRLLLDKNADINVMDHHGMTALSVAIAKDNLECTRLLLDRHAYIDEHLALIVNPKCKKMLSDESSDRHRRAAFDAFIKLS